MRFDARVRPRMFTVVAIAIADTAVASVTGAGQTPQVAIDPDAGAPEHRAPTNGRTRSCCGQVPSRSRLVRAGEEPDARLSGPASSEGPHGMVWIPGGEFTMGGDDEFAWPDEAPLHRVRVHGFWMDATEVTNGQFRNFIKATGYVTTAWRG